MVQNYEKIKEKYEKLQNIEGYIQLSGSEIKIFEKNDTLDEWDTLHKNNNFIIEAYFFNEDEKKSISIKQINNCYIYFEKILTNKELEDVNIFETKTNQKVKIAQIWEKIKDENCENFEVLKPTIQIFAGFEKGDKNDKSTI